VLLTATFALLAWVGPASATTIHITETSDPAFLDNDGKCSLREAVIAANADGGVDSCESGFGADTIVLPAGYYRLQQSGSEDSSLTGDMDLGGESPVITIRGAGRYVTIIDGNALDRVFQVLGGATASIESLMVTGGHVAAADTRGGGGILNEGTLELTDVVVSGNSTEDLPGGGVRSTGTLTVLDSLVLKNDAAHGNGGGINGDLTIRNSIVSGNTGQFGGGIYAGTVIATKTEVSANAAASDFQEGGGIYAGGSIRLTDVVVRGNTGNNGAGIAIIGASGPNELKRTVVSENVGAYGGGLQTYNNTGTVVITDSTFRNNAAGQGGGLYLYSDVQMSRSTVSGNTAQHGAGIYNTVDTQLTNVTITGNSAAVSFGAGGGIFNGAGDPDSLRLLNVTMAGNAAESGGNVLNSPPGFGEPGAVLHAKNSLFAADTGGGNCAGNPIVNDGHSLAFDTSGDECGLPHAAHLHLGPLKNNGGLTATRSIAPGDSPVNAGAGCPATDQRGVPRPQGPKCDIGAYELARCLGGTVNRVGTSGADRMTGDATAEVFLTLGGNDTVAPGGGGDRVCAGAGNDTVKIRGGGKDRADGGPGVDRVQRDGSDVVQAFERFF